VWVTPSPTVRFIPVQTRRTIHKQASLRGYSWSGCAISQKHTITPPRRYRLAGTGVLLLNGTIRGGHLTRNSIALVLAKSVVHENARLTPVFLSSISTPGGEATSD